MELWFFWIIIYERVDVKTVYIHRLKSIRVKNVSFLPQRKNILKALAYKRKSEDAILIYSDVTSMLEALLIKCKMYFPYAIDTSYKHSDESHQKRGLFVRKPFRKKGSGLKERAFHTLLLNRHKTREDNRSLMLRRRLCVLGIFFFFAVDGRDRNR